MKCPRVVFQDNSTFDFLPHFFHFVAFLFALLCRCRVVAMSSSRPTRSSNNRVEGGDHGRYAADINERVDTKFDIETGTVVSSLKGAKHTAQHTAQHTNEFKMIEKDKKIRSLGWIDQINSNNNNNNNNDQGEAHAYVTTPT